MRCMLVTCTVAECVVMWKSHSNIAPIKNCLAPLPLPICMSVIAIQVWERLSLRKSEGVLTHVALKHTPAADALIPCVWCSKQALPHTLLTCSVAINLQTTAYVKSRHNFLDGHCVQGCSTQYKSTSNILDATADCIHPSSW